MEDFMKNQFTTIFSILFLITTTHAFADFNSAADAYQNKQYAIALEEFSSLAKIGEVRSQTNLAVMYYYGHGVEQNLALAYAWARLGSENDKASSHSSTVLTAIEGSLTEKQSALEQYQQLADSYSYDILIKNTYPILIEAKDDTKKRSATAIKVIPPKYPKRALYRSTTGYVTIQFDIDRKGKPRNLRVVRSVPKDVFNKATLKVIPKWTFEPLKNDSGEPIWSFDLRYTLEYKLKDYDPINKKVYNKIKKNALAGDAASEYSYALVHQSLPSLKLIDDINPTEWFLKSARQGLPRAQYQLGSNLIYGKGCYEDKSKGIQWLNRAASNGVDEASEMLAKIAIQTPTLESQKQALALLSQSDKLSPAATIQFAWILSTSPFIEIRDPEKSIDMVEDLNYKKYKDEITKMEIIAASYAALGKFEKAVSIQENALEDAKDDELDLVDIKSHLELYKQNKTWF